MGSTCLKPRMIINKLGLDLENKKKHCHIIDKERFEYFYGVFISSSCSLIKAELPSVLASKPSPGMVGGQDSGLTAAAWNERKKIEKMMLEKPNSLCEHHHSSLH